MEESNFMDMVMELEEEDLAVVKEKEYRNDSLDSVIGTVDSFIRKQYLTELQEADVVPLHMKTDRIQVGRNIRLFQVISLSYSSTDDIYEKLANVFGAVAEFASSQILILDSDGYRVSLYLGIAGNETDKLSMQFNTFKGSFLGNFSGGKISMLNISKSEALLNSIFNEENIKISAVSALTTPKEHGKNKTYGIERFVEGMYGKPFTMLLISESVPKKELRAQRQNLEAMYTELSPFRDYTISINRNESKGHTQTYNLTKSESVTQGKSLTENTAFTKSKNQSNTITQNSEMENKRAKNQVTGTAASLAIMLAGLGSGTVHPLQGLFYGGSISNIIGSVQTLIDGADQGQTQTEGEGESYSVSFSEAETSSRQQGFSASKGISDSHTDANGQTLQMRYENKSVANLMSVIEQQIARLQHIEEIGGFCTAAYFVTGDNATALTVSNMYRSLLGGGNSLGQNNTINIWSDPKKVERICDYLKRLNHPLFHFEHKPDYPTFTAGSLVAADEFPMYAALPQKSIGGLPVAVRAEFAREATMSGSAEEQIAIGNIFHMGKEEVNQVCLSQEDLSGHLFVAGTTGMGKSNFCYGLLDSLYQRNVKFMVIEPAKGEYKQVFGGREDVSVFGTNPDITPLLRINPFSFPEGIHVNEHIGRLLEIFNSCWPMYAAMPEVLKEGMETIYRNCGYNLITGKNSRSNNTKNAFPTFADLLKMLPEIIHQSEFSGEVKGNYIGSLVTRVKSLTEGLYGCIFAEEEIDSSILFDENVLIDLSRVGSGETKALIMGIMVMKLQEYRMSHAKMNTPLMHLTVLEEAHHLLKAATVSSAEGVNLRAMSLEMITNAIAEMRTYGEGFLIADQSPTLMDLSVIRNTNTKVVFKLPEQSDRLAVGTAMSLTNPQINEIARLERGVAAVYQSNWDNAVLAKIRYFDSGNFKPYIHCAPDNAIESVQIYTQCLAILLKAKLSESGSSSLDTELCKELLSKAMYADSDSKEYFAVIKRYFTETDAPYSFAEICRYIDKIIKPAQLLKQCGETENLEQWEQRAKTYISSIAELTDAELRELIAICLNMQVMHSHEIKNLEIKKPDIKKPDIKKLYYQYFAFTAQKEELQ